MLYAAVGSSAWFLLAPAGGADGVPRARRVTTLLALWGTAVPAIVLFHTPAYVFRGLAFADDLALSSLGVAAFLERLAAGWSEAWRWWTEGPLPGWVWGAACVPGIALLPGGAARWRWLLQFAVMLVLNIAQRTSPPARVYMHLTLWMFVAAGVGIVGLLRWLHRRPDRTEAIASLAMLIVGGSYAVNQPVLFNVPERRNFADIPAAMQYLADEVRRDPGQRRVLLAPLPCDLPSIFYLRRAGVEVSVNARPESGQRATLITRPGESPDDVLATPLLDMADLAPGFADWQPVRSFETLALSTATFGDDPERPERR
jgi:hypothetical protein